MRKLATLTAAAALLAAGGLLLTANVASAGEVTVLSCAINGATWDVKACDSTDVGACNGGTPTTPYAVGDPCVDALKALIVDEFYGGRKSYQFSPVGDGTDIVYTLIKGD